MESDAFLAEIVIWSSGRVDVSRVDRSTGIFVDSSTMFEGSEELLVDAFRTFGVAWTPLLWRGGT